MTLPNFRRRLLRPPIRPSAEVFVSIALTALTALVPAGAALDPLDVPKVPCPIYIMEYHVWYRSPAGSAQPGYVHWGDTSNINQPSPDAPSVRDMGAKGYPLLGLYDSENTDVIRWQLRCLHNTGVDGVFVQLFPDRQDGTYLGGTRAFALILKIAREEHVQVAAHDEVMFRDGTRAQQPGPMAERISAFVRRFGHDPAYLKIDGSPVYAFQYWTPFMPPDQLAACLNRAQDLVGGPIHFLVMGGMTAELEERPAPTSFVVAGNSGFIKPGGADALPGIEDWLRLTVAGAEVLLWRASYPSQRYGLWAYPGFDNAPMNRDQPQKARGFARDGGRVFVNTIKTYLRFHPDFIMLSSWNDWMENTAFEPGCRFRADETADAQDPYRYCRLLARLRGLNFAPPPLPPPAAVDPLRHEALYGGDEQPPRLVNITIVSRTCVHSDWSDDKSGVAEAIATETGEASADLARNVLSHVRLIGDPQRMTNKLGYLLSARAPLTLSIDPLPPGENAWYCAVFFEAPAALHLTADYSGRIPFLDYREFDGVQLPVDPPTVFTGGSDTSAVRVMILPAANFSSGRPFFTLSLAPSDAAKNQSLYIRRIELFRMPIQGTPGRRDPACTAKGPTAGFDFDLPDRPDTLFLFARDRNNNWTAPIPVDVKSDANE